MLSIQLLGALQLALDGRSLAVPRASHLEALLGRLVLQPGTPWSRTRLAEQFWPESSEEQARTNLRKAILALRKALPEPEHFLATQGSTIFWREDAPYTSDVAVFTAAVQAAESADTLSRAIALYTGDLLPDCDDEEIDHERSRLRQLFSGLLERAIAESEARQDFSTALTYAQRLQVHDALSEPAYQHLIRLHARLGDRAAAAQAYQACTDMLRDEFDMQPSAVTTELMKQALAGQFAVAASPGPEQPPVPVSTGQPQAGPMSAPAAPAGATLSPVWTLLSWTHLYRALLERASRLVRSEVAAFLPGGASLPLPDGRFTVTMEAEAAETTPGSFIAVRGTSTGLPRRALMWTVVHTNGYFWPQTQVLRFGGRWTGYARVGDSSADSGKRLEVLAVLVDRQTASEFRQWLRNGDRNGRYPPMTSLLPGAQIAARVEVTVT